MNTAAQTLSPREMEAKCLDRYASLIGTKRDDTMAYMQGLIMGRYGTTSQSGRDYARRVLDAMRSPTAAPPAQQLALFG